MQPLLCLCHHRQVKQAVVKNLVVLNIINTDTKTYKKYKKSQGMIKKLSSSHQEIKIIAE
jgi:hypothetical protein